MHQGCHGLFRVAFIGDICFAGLGVLGFGLIHFWPMGMGLKHTDHIVAGPWPNFKAPGDPGLGLSLNFSFWTWVRFEVFCGLWPGLDSNC